MRLPSGKSLPAASELCAMLLQGCVHQNIGARQRGPVKQGKQQRALQPSRALPCGW